MKNKATLFLLLIIFFSSKNLIANHLAGGEITYLYLGNSKYLINVKLYRDCRGTELENPTIGWRAGSGSNTTCGSGLLTNFKRRSITDISAVCTSGTKPCSPANKAASGDGFEEHIYTDTLDFSKSPFASILSNSSCTELLIYAGQCCRTTTITTIPSNSDFWVTSLFLLDNIRKCKTQTNNSVQFGRNWQNYLCCNTASYMSMAAKDTNDMDSLSYKLSPTIGKLPNVTTGYISPFSEDFPLTPYCVPPSNIKCTPNITTNPPKGFYMNPSTGDLIFTPIKCDEVFVIVVEATEWRRDTTGKYVAISKTYRDVQIIVKDDCGYNNSPTITGNFKHKVIAGDKICTKFTLDDKVFSPFQKNKDSIIISWDGASSKPKWTLTRDTSVNKATIDFCWETDKKDASRVPYVFSISVNDNYCSRPVTASRSFEVLVQTLDTATIKITPGQICSGAKFEAALNKGQFSDGIVSWEVFDSASSKKIFNSNQKAFTRSYLPKGTYKAVFSINHNDYYYQPVTAYFKITTDMPTTSLGADFGVCLNNTAKATSTSNAMKSPLVYSWNINGITDSAATQNSYTFAKVDTTKNLILTVKDAEGCMAIDTLVFRANALPIVTWVKSPLDPICWSTGDFLLNNAIASPAANLLKPGNFRITGSQF
ncbi:MAG: hypothetical protein IT244_05755, partial [Bacteroidia bacterium]|nr:hypothetical protein [Bacteroidia bacterium]